MKSLLRRSLLMLLVAMLAASATLIGGCTGGSDEDETLSGQTVVQEKCTTCHELNVVNEQPDTVDWNDVIDRMINEQGAEITDAEKAAAIEYLSNR